MIRRWHFLLALSFCVLTFLSSTTPSRADERPNFIVFIADDMAWDDCGAYGHPAIRTPNIDRLAKEGMRFDQAFLTCSSCSPSRSSILTGRYPHSTGAMELHQSLPPSQVTIAQLLKKQGYYTASAGKWHLGNNVRGQFDTIAEGQKGAWQQVVRERPRDQPFFMWLAFYDPHRGYSPKAIPEPHKPEDAQVPPYLPDVPATRKDLAMYYDEITRLDGVVGEVMEELERQQVADNTLVIFISDNGRPFPRCKTTVYDSGVKTPFICRWPKQVKPGSVSQSLVSTVDIVPTLLELAGGPKQPTFQGHSFTAILKDPQAETRDYVFAEHNWHDYTAHERAARSKRFKYITNAYPDLPGTPPADAVRSLTYTAMQEMHKAGTLKPEQEGCFLTPRPTEELYDLESDPDELVNLAADPQHQQTLRQMREVLAEWRKETSDSIPEKRTPDGFDRETGLRVKKG